MTTLEVKMVIDFSSIALLCAQTKTPLCSSQVVENVPMQPARHSSWTIQRVQLVCASSGPILNL